MHSPGDLYSKWIIANQASDLETITSLVNECETERAKENLLNHQDRETGKSALHLACQVRSPESAIIVRYLTKHSQCNVNLRDKDGNTPMHLAAAKLNYSCFEILESMPQIRKDCVNKYNQTFLSESQSQGW